MAWIALVVAGLLEMTGVAMMARLHQKKTIGSVALLVASFGGSFLFLSIAMETLPMGMAYAIWTGIGAAGGAVLGMVFYKESAAPLRLFFLGLIIASVVGLKLVS
ncbi:QacE family quaternary ammonium compound efflux SMR transporter [Tetzosporium hominis]|uniref:QacE family quaternary ammonium compound efflux SMR transporter n=1 Tax=Tetzosporium hominis TaxID=2020506 RepID=A0A264W4V6_9BACL|nr:multidrug efflux SMR transporter [Tetzosporium hominis]OZS78604.1 QacE family quaternary ammonium compound efflux SMR transporter [Tetzosporium hominis]